MRYARTVRETVHGNPGERRVLPAGLLIRIVPASNLPPGSRIKVWASPLRRAPWPAETAAWAKDVGVGLEDGDYATTRDDGRLCASCGADILGNDPHEPACLTERWPTDTKVSEWDDYATDARGMAVLKYGRVVRAARVLVLVRWEGRTRDKWVSPHRLHRSGWTETAADPFPVPSISPLTTPDAPSKMGGMRIKQGDRVSATVYGADVNGTVTRIGQGGIVFVCFDGSPRERWMHATSLRTESKVS